MESGVREEGAGEVSRKLSQVEPWGTSSRLGGTPPVLSLGLSLPGGHEGQGGTPAPEMLFAVLDRMRTHHTVARGMFAKIEK